MISRFAAFACPLRLSKLGNSLWFAADQYYILRDIQLLPEREQKTVLRRIHLVIWSCCFVWVFVPLTINGYEPGFEMTPWAFVLTLGPHCLGEDCCPNGASLPPLADGEEEMCRRLLLGQRCFCWNTHVTPEQSAAQFSRTAHHGPGSCGRRSYSLFARSPAVSLLFSCGRER